MPFALATDPNWGATECALFDSHVAGLNFGRKAPVGIAKVQAELDRALGTRQKALLALPAQHALVRVVRVSFAELSGQAADQGARDREYRRHQNRSGSGPLLDEGGDERK
jgi:hypothetical protein